MKAVWRSTRGSALFLCISVSPRHCIHTRDCAFEYNSLSAVSIDHVDGFRRNSLGRRNIFSDLIGLSTLADVDILQGL